MKHRTYQSIVKMNLCYFHYLSNTTWADYKSLTSGNHPTQKIMAMLLKLLKYTFPFNSCYWKTKLLHNTQR